jgi:AcrR family transcriptional regulator
MTERTARRRRIDGEQSRRRILDAAAEIAGERGYDGTTISAVSSRCGLPASSIYWHFADKDELIAAVIERSFADWLSALTLPGTDTGTGDVTARVTAMATQVAKALLETPDFLRLGLMLTLERRPVQTSARTKFLQVRQLTREKLAQICRELAPDLDTTAVERITTYAIAGADGLFVAREIGGDAVDVVAMFDLHARVLVRILAGELTEDRDR